MTIHDDRPLTFLLVHGAWHGGWCWRRTSEILLSRGHRVLTPTLSGLAERSHQACAEIDLDAHIRDVVNIIRWERLTDIVLCGHSYGGMVISGVAEAVTPGAIRSIVFLDAFLPEDGKSLLDYAVQFAGRDLFGDAESTGFARPISAAALSINEADRMWVETLCTPQPYRTFTQRIRLTGALGRIPHKTYIKATGYSPSAFDTFAQAVRRNAAWRYVEITGGHDIMIDAPDQLAQALKESAK